MKGFHRSLRKLGTSLWWPQFCSQRQDNRLGGLKPYCVHSSILSSSFQELPFLTAHFSQLTSYRECSVRGKNAAVGRSCCGGPVPVWDWVSHLSLASSSSLWACLYRTLGPTDNNWPHFFIGNSPPHTPFIVMEMPDFKAGRMLLKSYSPSNSDPNFQLPGSSYWTK